MELQSELRMEPMRRARPIDVMPCPTGRRRWPDALKARIVAETLQSGSQHFDVAARYRLLQQHLSARRSMARMGTLVLALGDMPAFVPSPRGSTVMVMVKAALVVTGPLRCAFGWRM